MAAITSKTRQMLHKVGLNPRASAVLTQSAAVDWRAALRSGALSPRQVRTLRAGKLDLKTLLRGGFSPAQAKLLAVPPGMTDNFNRADSATSLGTPSDGGVGYTTIPASSGSFAFGISSNKAYLAATGIAGQYAGTYWSAIRVTPKADIDFSIDFSRTGSTQKAIIIFGADPANNNQGYILEYGTGTLWLRPTNAGGSATGAVIGNNPSFAATSGTFRITRVAATGVITVYFNGVQQYQVTDTTWTAGKAVGFGAAGTADGDRWDNFVAV